jgi:type I restriction enzyme, S subunit
MTKREESSLPFSDALKDTSRLGTKIPASQYLRIGKLPIIDQGKDFISGYIEDDSLKYKGDLPVIIFGDHTRAIKYVDFDFAMGADGVKVLTPTSDYLPEFLYFYLKANPIESAGYSRHFKYLKQLDFPKLTLDKQYEVVNVLSRADSIIDLHKQVIKKTHALISSIFFEYFGDLPSNQKSYPLVKMSDICDIVRESIRAGDRPELKYIGLENIESMTGQYLEATEERSDVNSTTVYFDSKFILFSKLRPYLNKVFLPTFEGKCTSELIPLVPKEGVNKEFLASFLRTDYVVDLLMSKNTGARMPRANIDVLMGFTFGLPPRQLQDKFSNIVGVIQNLQSLHAQRITQAVQNFESLANQLFAR